MAPVTRKKISARSRTPACRATWAAAACTWRAPSTWRATRAISCRPARRSSAAAAARRRSTSTRCAKGFGRSVRASRARARIACTSARGRVAPALREGRARRRTSQPVPLARALALGREDRRAASSSRRVEIVPPRGVDAIAHARRRRRSSRRAGVDAVNVPDGPRAQSRMGALLTCAAHRAAGRHRDGDALRLPRPQPARHAERPARRVGRRPAQPAAHHRRPAEDGAVSRAPPRCSTSTRSGSPTS